MIKRVTAALLALGMAFGSTMIPKAETGGEPVGQTETKIENATIETKAQLSYKDTTLKPIIPIPVKPVKEADNDGTANYQGERNTGNDGGGTDTGTATGISGPVELPNRGSEDLEKSDQEIEGGGEYSGTGPELNDIAEPVPDTIEAPADPEQEPEEAPIEEPEQEPEQEPQPETVEVTEPTEPIEEPEQAPAMEYLGDWTISFYCNCIECCGRWSGGATASEVMPTPWWTAATDGLAFGSVVYVEGLGEFVIEDRGTEYGWLDVFVSDHGEALANGLQYRAVYLVG